MSMMRTVFVFVLFNIAVNILANLFAQGLPMAYSGQSGQQYYANVSGQSDLNVSEISSSQAVGFAIDPRKGLSILTNLKNYVLGGATIVALFGLDPGSGTGAQIAAGIDAFQLFVYVFAIFVLFTGRGD